MPVKGTRTTLLRQQANERTSSAKAAAMQHDMCAMVHQFPTPASHPHFYGSNAIHTTACQAIGQRMRVEEALTLPHMRTAMNDELRDRLADGSMWWTAIPQGASVLSHTWIFAEKFDPVTHVLLKGKARICPHGFWQIKHKDFDPDRVSSPTIDPTSVKIYFAAVLFFDMVEVQLDVVGAFPSVGSDNGAARGLFIQCPQGPDPSHTRHGTGHRQRAGNPAGGIQLAPQDGRQPEGQRFPPRLG